MLINKYELSNIIYPETKHLKLRSNILTSTDPQVKKEIQKVLELTKYYKKEDKYDTKKDFSIRLKMIKENWTKEDITCKKEGCSNITSFFNKDNNFRKYCSSKCSNSADEKKRVTEQSNLKKYGVKHTFQTKELQDKSKLTMLQKYGVDNSMKLEFVKEKAKKTCLLNYGVDNIFKVEKIKEIRFKSRTEHLNNNEYWNNKEFIEKSFITKEQFLDASKFQDFFGCGSSLPYSKCKKLGIDYKKMNGYSLKEKEVYDYIKSIYQKEIIENDRNLIKNELDIVIPEFKFAIEFNGIFWHSLNAVTYDNFKKYNKKNSHCEKTEECFKKGYKLFHIFENEWDTKKDIWKSKIALELGIIEKRIFARKCEIKEVDNEEKNKFLEENHLQGTCSSSVNIGLYYQNELVSIMTFGKTRFSKKYQYELIRFCSLKNHKIIGGASRLLKYFERNYNPKSIISYANRRWSNGELYNALNFEYLHKASPNHYYIDKNYNTLYHRVKYQKHKVQKIMNKLEIQYNPNISAMDNCIFNLNLGVIWDSGNLVFLKEY